jgi:hypothetical protein
MRGGRGRVNGALEHGLVVGATGRLPGLPKGINSRKGGGRREEKRRKKGKKKKKKRKKERRKEKEGGKS